MGAISCGFDSHLRHKIRPIVDTFIYYIYNLWMLERAKSTIGAVKGAIEIRIYEAQRYSDLTDSYPPIGIEKALLILRTLRPQELRNWIKVASSVNYGKSLLDEVFPKFDNPDDFHSSEDFIALNENPTQVLGWADYERMIKTGNDSGLIDNWIRTGFCRRADQRGISLEWSFFEFPKDKKQIR